MSCHFSPLLTLVYVFKFSLMATNGDGANDKGKGIDGNQNKEDERVREVSKIYEKFFWSLGTKIAKRKRKREEGISGNDLGDSYNSSDGLSGLDVNESEAEEHEVQSNVEGKGGVENEGAKVCGGEGGVENVGGNGLGGEGRVETKGGDDLGLEDISGNEEGNVEGYVEVHDNGGWFDDSSNDEGGNDIGVRTDVLDGGEPWLSEKEDDSKSEEEDDSNSEDEDYIAGGGGSDSNESVDDDFDREEDWRDIAIPEDERDRAEHLGGDGDRQYFYAGRSFANKETLKKAIANYAMQNGVNVRYAESNTH